MALAIIAGLLVVGAIVWLWPGSREEAVAPSAPVPAPTQAPGAPVPLATREVPPLDLPPLPASDAFVRDLVSRLSSQPQLARWLVTDDLIQRFVGVVVDLAGVSNPSAHVPFMIPPGDFVPERSGSRMVIDQTTHRRYDLISATFVSLHTDRSVELYLQLRPLIQEAYGQLGIPDLSFDELLALAIQNVRSVQVPEQPLEVVGRDGVYVFADQELESRRGAEKALLRMGPSNTRRIQAKMGEFGAALGITP
jgi:hypothetical protein